MKISLVEFKVFNLFGSRSKLFWTLFIYLNGDSYKTLKFGLIALMNTNPFNFYII